MLANESGLHLLSNVDVIRPGSYICSVKPPLSWKPLRTASGDCPNLLNDVQNNPIISEYAPKRVAHFVRKELLLLAAHPNPKAGSDP